MPIYFALFLLAAAPSLDWPQWGGPERNFKSDAKGLANSWPASGPKRVWSRNSATAIRRYRSRRRDLYHVPPRQR